MPVDPLFGAIIDAGRDLAGGSNGERAVLVPRLVVRGDGSTGTQTFNLKLTNVGKGTAFGVTVGVPWHQLKRNGTKLGGATYWWKKHTPWYLTVLNKTRLFRRLPRPLRLCLLESKLLITKDVGLILSPGESTELYFGKFGKSAGGFTAENAGGLVWRMGEITALTLTWCNRPKRWTWLWRRTTKHKLAIHSKEGAELSAHGKWTSVNPDS